MVGPGVETLDSWDFEEFKKPEGQLYRAFNIKCFNLIKKNTPKIVFFEDINGIWQNPYAQNYYVTMRGILLMHCYAFNAEVRGYNQMTLKKAVTGNGRAKKHQIMKYVADNYPRLHCKNDDEADAVMIMQYGMMDIRGKLPKKTKGKVTQAQKIDKNQDLLPF